jgi:hypothetical protein
MRALSSAGVAFTFLGQTTTLLRCAARSVSDGLLDTVLGPRRPISSTDRWMATMPTCHQAMSEQGVFFGQFDSCGSS